MLVVMLHYLVYHVTREKMVEYWKAVEVERLEGRLAVAEEWIDNMGKGKIGEVIKNGDGSVAMEEDNSVENGGLKNSVHGPLNNMLKDADEATDHMSSDESTKDQLTKVKNLTTHFSAKRFTHQQPHYTRKIVTYYKYNDALLRSAVRNGTTNAHQGEVEVLMKIRPFDSINDSDNQPVPRCVSRNGSRP